MYNEHLHFFYEANNVLDDSKKRVILLSPSGTVTYELFRGLPWTPGVKGLKYSKAS